MLRFSGLLGACGCRIMPGFPRLAGEFPYNPEQRISVSETGNVSPEQGL
jgi:hypothetical protein